MGNKPCPIRSGYQHQETLGYPVAHGCRRPCQGSRTPRRHHISGNIKGLFAYFGEYLMRQATDSTLGASSESRFIKWSFCWGASDLSECQTCYVVRNKKPSFLFFFYLCDIAWPSCLILVLLCFFSLGDTILAPSLLFLHTTPTISSPAIDTPIPFLKAGNTAPDGVGWY